MENEAGPSTLAVGLVLLSEQCEVTKKQNKTKHSHRRVQIRQTHGNSEALRAAAWRMQEDGWRGGRGEVKTFIGKKEFKN